MKKMHICKGRMICLWAETPSVSHTLDSSLKEGASAEEAPRWPAMKDFIFRYDLFRENAVLQSPQALQNCKYKNKISFEYAQSAAESIYNCSP